MVLPEEDEPMAEPRVVLITGSASGFGLLTTRALMSRGHTVLATMRDPVGGNREVARSLVAESEEGPGCALVLALDVTDDASVERAVAAGLDLAGRIDVAVNNAGMSLSGLAEAFTAEEMRRLFEINVFGAQRVNRAVLPSMRSVGAGLLVHVSSTFGRFVVPFVAPYTATKWALEALAESYAQELAGTGVEVAIVEPGPFPTPHASKIGGPEDADRIASYGELADRAGPMWGDFVSRMEDADPQPEDVARALVELIESPSGNRPLRTVVDPGGGGRVAGELNREAARLRDEFFDAVGIAGSVPRT